MSEKMNMDTRLESALQEDASQLSQLSSDVPESLRTRIARTPSVAATPSLGTAAAPSMLISVKFILVSLGGLSAIVAAYLALKPVDRSAVSGPELSTPPAAVITIDTPRQSDSVRGGTMRSKTIPPELQKEQTGYSQTDVDKLLRDLPEPESTVRQSDSIKAEVTRGRSSRKK